MSPRMERCCLPTIKVCPLPTIVKLLGPPEPIKAKMAPLTKMQLVDWRAIVMQPRLQRPWSLRQLWLHRQGTCYRSSDRPKDEHLERVVTKNLPRMLETSGKLLATAANHLMRSQGRLVQLLPKCKCFTSTRKVCLRLSRSQLVAQICWQATQAAATCQLDCREQSMRKGQPRTSLWQRNTVWAPHSQLIVIEIKDLLALTQWTTQSSRLQGSMKWWCLHKRSDGWGVARRITIKMELCSWPRVLKFRSWNEWKRLFTPSAAALPANKLRLVSLKAGVKIKAARPLRNIDSSNFITCSLLKAYLNRSDSTNKPRKTSNSVNTMTSKQQTRI